MRFRNKDATINQADEYRYLADPFAGFRAYQVTNAEWSRIAARRSHPGNRREIFLMSWAIRIAIVLLMLASGYAGIRIERSRWLAEPSTVSPGAVSDAPETIDRWVEGPFLFTMGRGPGRVRMIDGYSFDVEPGAVAVWG